jgi:hypothetical protein
MEKTTAVDAEQDRNGAGLGEGDGGVDLLQAVWSGVDLRRPSTTSSPWRVVPRWSL